MKQHVTFPQCVDKERHSSTGSKVRCRDVHAAISTFSIAKVLNTAQNIAYSTRIINLNAI
jgi:hypothetical protein